MANWDRQNQGAPVGSNTADITVLTGRIDNLESGLVGNLALTTVDINGGAIDGTPIGANSANTGAFTTFSITGSAVLASAITISATLNSATFIGGGGNVAIGADVMASGNNTYNVAIGANALDTCSDGNFNVAVGRYAMNSAIACSMNTALGMNALATVLGDRNVGLGFYAGANEVGNDTFYIDNQTRGSLAGGQNYSLLYGTFNSTYAGQVLHVNTGSAYIASHLIVSGPIRIWGAGTGAVSGAICFSTDGLFYGCSGGGWNALA